MEKSERKQVKLDDVWISFFNRAFEIAETCRSENLLSAEDCVRKAGVLYFTLPAVTVLDGLLRSLHIADGVSLAIGRVLTSATCPPKYRAMLSALESIKKLLKAAELKEP